MLRLLACPGRGPWPGALLLMASRELVSALLQCVGSSMRWTLAHMSASVAWVDGKY